MIPEGDRDGKTFAFDRASSSTSVDGVNFSGAIEQGWDINGNANGGYLLALAGAAMRDASGRPDPISISAHFLAPGLAGPITISTDVVKSGRCLLYTSPSPRDS